ncbi:MAG: winged helix-turn-helix domain-containing protein [Acidimicrobiia bacterium]|nr:winged helix-turn-helix domain-containing protein [Acidimicrobiia bacterium]
MILETPEQLKAFAEPNRTEILQLLAERPATVTELAEAMDRPKGSVAHHVTVLEEAGLVEVVRTRKVRAVTERFYARTARTFVLAHDDSGSHLGFLREALQEAREPAEGESAFFTLRYARVPTARLEEFGDRLVDLAEEFAAQPRSGETVYGLIFGIYPTDRPSLGEES